MLVAAECRVVGISATRELVDVFGYDLDSAKPAKWRPSRKGCDVEVAVMWASAGSHPSADRDNMGERFLVFLDVSFASDPSCEVAIFSAF